MPIYLYEISFSIIKVKNVKKLCDFLQNYDNINKTAICVDLIQKIHLIFSYNFLHEQRCGRKLVFFEL